MKFSRITDQPFIARTAGTFYSELVANPDILEFKGNFYFFFRGQGASGHDQIGLWSKPSTEADGINWDKSHTEPIVCVSQTPEAHDSDHILDPAAIAFNGSIYLYYTSKSKLGENNYSISLSISNDGEIFEKYGDAPVLINVIAPEVVFHEGRIHLFFQRHNVEKDCWDVFKRTSLDGVNFPEETERLVFQPTLSAGSIDSKSLATVRIFQGKDSFYLTFGACQKFLDYPETIGLAKSVDLINWDRYPDNPIFTRGEIGSWDEGAIWYPTIHKFKDGFFMWYEGAGTGLKADSVENKAASTSARNENYGGYLESSFSQVGIASYKGELPVW